MNELNAFLESGRGHVVDILHELCLLLLWEFVKQCEEVGLERCGGQFVVGRDQSEFVVEVQQIGVSRLGGCSVLAFVHINPNSNPRGDFGDGIGGRSFGCVARVGVGGGCDALVVDCVFGNREDGLDYCRVFDTLTACIGGSVYRCDGAGQVGLDYPSTYTKDLVQSLGYEDSFDS